MWVYKPRFLSPFLSLVLPTRVKLYNFWARPFARHSLRLRTSKRTQSHQNYPALGYSHRNNVMKLFSENRTKIHLNNFILS
ncbi:hypothetical protein C2G38_43814 [Gigaspora rosea]|uniref:Uncharacterized protein n=1 Tax=Gigaspora rosea TaxID=44941 RepID=A0A397W1U6_9GLOM|nr:hypothetical protein C2G38_43814 [Gigaspora rosea]